MHKKRCIRLLLSTIVSIAMMTMPVMAAEEIAEEVTTEEVTEDTSESPADKDTTPLEDNLDKASDDEKSTEDSEIETSLADIDNTLEELEEIEEVATPTPKPEEKTTVPKGSKSAKETTKWDISGKGFQEAQKAIKDLYISSGVNRFEIFYNVSGGEPKVYFKSPKGNTYRSDVTVEYGDKEFVIRKNNYIVEYPDINYMVIYIDGTKEPGDWTMGVTLNKGTTEFIMTTNTIPDNWDTLAQEYRTAPHGVILWAIDKEKSKYNSSNINDIVSKDKEIPEANNIKPLSPEEINPPKEKNPMIGIIALIVISIVGGIVGVVFLFKKLTKESEETKKMAIKTANARVKKKKKLENDHLDKVMEHYGDEYADEDDIEGYLMFSSEYKDEDETKEPESEADNTNNQAIDYGKFKNMTAVDENSDISVPKTDNEPEKEESLTIPLPEWKRPQVLAGAKTPSWLVPDEDDDAVFF